ncbi:MAG: PIG-L deacetylase family protein [Actinomycetes bacterium]
MLPDDETSRVLAVTAHPDDIDFLAAGTIAGWTDRGIEVTYCIITDGDAGGSDHSVDRAQIPIIRRAEQVAAAQIVGVTDVRFLGYRDGELTVTHELRRDISRVIRQVRPQRILIQTPERNWDSMPGSHPDHLASGEAAIQAVFPDAGNPFAHTSLLQDEGLDGWSVSEVWVMGHSKRTQFSDITDQFDRKIAALRAHQSQTGERHGLDELIRDWGARIGAEAGFEPGRLAEGFFVARMPG